MFELYMEKDGDDEIISIGRGRCAHVRFNGDPVCSIENGVGYCCGATFLCQFFSRAFPQHFESLIAFLKENINKKLHPDMYWSLQDKVFMYLSDETVIWDAPIRNHPKVSIVYSFNNKATKPYTGSMVYLCVLDLS